MHSFNTPTVASLAKHLVTTTLLLALAILFSAPAIAMSPSGAYTAYIIFYGVPYADTLTFTPSPGNPEVGTVVSTLLGPGKFHFSTSQDLLLMMFGIDYFVEPPTFVFAGKLDANGQWQGVFSWRNHLGGGWTAQQGSYSAPVNYGAKIEIGEAGHAPFGPRDYCGTESPWSEPLSFRLSDLTGAAGLVVNFGTGENPDAYGHFDTLTYPANNEQLFVIGVNTTRVYGGVVHDLGPDKIRLEGAWYNAGPGYTGTFQVDHDPSHNCN